MASPPLIEDQGRLLEEALLVVSSQSKLMTRFLDQPVSSFAMLSACWPNQLTLCAEQAHGRFEMRVSL
jgi:hypothetical protein